MAIRSTYRTTMQFPSPFLCPANSFHFTCSSSLSFPSLLLSFHPHAVFSPQKFHNTITWTSSIDANVRSSLFVGPNRRLGHCSDRKQERPNICEAFRSAAQRWLKFHASPPPVFWKGRIHHHSPQTKRLSTHSPAFPRFSDDWFNSITIDENVCLAVAGQPHNHPVHWRTLPRYFILLLRSNLLSTGKRNSNLDSKNLNTFHFT